MASLTIGSVKCKPTCLGVLWVVLSTLSLLEMPLPHWNGGSGQGWGSCQDWREVFEGVNKKIITLGCSLVAMTPAGCFM